MRKAATLPADHTMSVKVPWQFRRRGGRKLVVAAAGADPWIMPHQRIDNTMVKALARAHRWRALLEDGTFASVTELAEAEKINLSYLCRVLRLTLLAPDIVETILAGRQPALLQLDDLLKQFPVEWDLQRTMLVQT